jgi:hypothetical protein
MSRMGSSKTDIAATEQRSIDSGDEVPQILAVAFAFEIVESMEDNARRWRRICSVGV